jgi:polysaccharide biosynthesis transport protein
MESASFIDIRDVLRGIARRWFSILLFTAGCAVLSYWFVNNVKPVYTAQAQVLISNQDSPFTRVVQDRIERGSLTEREIASQVQVVLSRDLAMKVIEDLKLNEVAEFDPLKSGIGQVGRLMISFGLKPDPATMTEEQRIIDHYFDKLSAFEVPGSSVITVKFESRDPQLATSVANRIAEYYILFSRQAMNEPTDEARDWLATQIDDLRRKVVESEGAVERFRAEAGIFRGAQAKLDNEELSSLNSQIILASAARSEAEAKAASIRNLLKTTGTVDTSADVLSSPLIQRLREQQVQLTRSRAELSTIYLDNHPRIIAVNRELEDLNRQLRNEAFKVVERLEQEAKVAAARENSLRQNLDTLKQQANVSSADDVRLRELEREAAANRSLLESFLVRYTDANARRDSSAQPGLGRIISAAGVPSTPSFPKKGPIMLLATLGGFMLALGLAFVVEVLGAAGQAAARPAQRMAPPPVPAAPQVQATQPTAHSAYLPPVPAATAAAPNVQMPANVVPPYAGAAISPVPATPVAAAMAPSAAPSGVQLLAALPAMQTSMVAMHAASQALFDTGSVYRAAVEPVAAGLAHLVQQGGHRRISLINLTGRDLDSATLTLGLGRLLAARGFNTVLVDTASGGAGVSTLLPAVSAKGIFDLVAGAAGFSDVVRKDAQTPLQVISAGSAPAAPQLDSAAVAKLEQAIKALEQVYQVCLVHLGEGNAGNVELAANSQVVLVLAEAGRVAEAREICDALKSGRVRQAEVISVQAGTQQASGSAFQNIAASL